MDETLYLDDTIKQIELFFRCMGLNIKSKENTENNIKSRFLYVINFLWLNTDLLGAMLWFRAGLIDGKNLTELTYIAPCITLSFLYNFKTISLVAYERTAHVLIATLRDLEIKQNLREKTDEEVKIIEEEKRFLDVVMKGSKILNYVLIVTFGCSPLALMALNYFKNGRLEFLLPFLIVYPFDAYNIKVWPVIFLRQIWSETVVVLGICATDFLFYTFCVYISIQFRLLGYNIETIIPDSDLGSKKHFHGEFRIKLVEIIKWHQELIRAAGLVEEIYSKSTLYNFVTSSVIICLTGFNVTVINDVAVMVAFLSFLFMSLLQIVSLCFFGDKLMQSSTDVSDAVYNSKWYLADAKVGKHLLMVQIRAQKACRLTAYGFAEVNLRAFMRILSTAWSYFALLQTMYGSNE